MHRHLCTPLREWLALGRDLAANGASPIQRNSSIIGQPIRGGTTIGIWTQSSGTTHTFRTGTVPSANNRKTIAAYNVNVPNGENAAWTASTTKAYI